MNNTMNYQNEKLWNSIVLRFAFFALSFIIAGPNIPVNAKMFIVMSSLFIVNELRTMNYELSKRFSLPCKGQILYKP